MTYMFIFNKNRQKVTETITWKRLGVKYSRVCLSVDIVLSYYWSIYRSQFEHLICYHEYQYEIHPHHHHHQIRSCHFLVVPMPEY